jgi:hypothetical protein
MPRPQNCSARAFYLETLNGGATMRLQSSFRSDQAKEDLLMTKEEMQKAMEFIVQQQAQSSAKIDALSEVQKEAHKGAEERWKRSDERWERTEEGIRALLSIAEIHEREIATLGEKIAAVSENGRATDERLNALINTVERQISEGRNGKP